MSEFHPNFPYSELVHTDHREFDNTPTETEKCIIGGKEVLVNAVANLPRLSQFLGKLKFEVFGGKAVFVSSGFRSHDVNTAVKSKDTSDHRRGCAADIKVDGMTPDQVTKAIIDSGIEFEQVIREFDRWTHIAIPMEGAKGRMNKMIIDAQTPNGRPYA
jgi:hypothetical protein